MMLGLCACMGAVYGEPYCPCEMRQRGLPSSAEHLAAMKKANQELGRIFGPGGEYENPEPTGTKVQDDC